MHYLHKYSYISQLNNFISLLIMQALSISSITVNFSYFIKKEIKI